MIQYDILSEFSHPFKNNIWMQTSEVFISVKTSLYFVRIVNQFTCSMVCYIDHVLQLCRPYVSFALGLVLLNLYFVIMVLFVFLHYYVLAY